MGQRAQLPASGTPTAGIVTVTGSSSEAGGRPGSAHDRRLMASDEDRPVNLIGAR